MVTGLVDTSIVIDLMRSYQPAHAWFVAQSDLGVCRAVWFEVIEGVKNLRSQRESLALLREFHLYELTIADTVWAAGQLLALHLSHNVDAFDCLIASVSHRLQLPLYTRNLKHFAPLLGDLAITPY
jgi:predicted nucleic acid-binding protein